MSINESQFYMWRALFALAHADHVVSPEEIRFMAEALEDVPFSDEQYAVLKEDIKEPQDIEAMFTKIEDVRDQAEFFKFAHGLVHIDGDYGAEEQDVMLRLKEIHMKRGDLESLVGFVGLELEGEEGASGVERLHEPIAVEDILSSFKERFLIHKSDD